MLNNIINDLRNLEGQEVGKQTYFHKMYTNKAEINEISTIDVLESLKQYEVTSFESYNYDAEEEYEVNFDEYLELCEYEEIQCNNSYNWSAPLTNHINYRIYKSATCDNVIVELSVHRYGDVRCNYTEDCYLEFDNEYEFYEVLSENNKYFTIEKDNVRYDITIDIFSDCPQIEKNIDDKVKYIEGYEATEILEQLIEDEDIKVL